MLTGRRGCVDLKQLERDIISNSNRSIWPGLGRLRPIFEPLAPATARNRMHPDPAALFSQKTWQNPGKQPGKPPTAKHFKNLVAWMWPEAHL